MRCLVTPVVTLVALAGLHCGECRGSLLSNGSFETGDFSGWTTNDGSGSVLSQFVGTFFGGSSDGDFALQMNDGDFPPSLQIEQSVATSAGNWYFVTFDYGRYDPTHDPLDDSEARILVEVIGATSSTLLVDLAVDNRQDLGGAFMPLAPGQFLTYNGFFMADGSVSTLRITDASTGTLGVDTVVDNFNLNRIVVDSFTPEPSTLVLLAMGMAGGWARTRRRR